MRMLSTMLVLMPTLALASGVSSLDPTTITVSDSSRVVAANLVPEADKHPRLVNHVALAEEAYENKMSLLRDRRDDVRHRKLGTHLASFATFAVTTIGVGVASMAATKDDRDPAEQMRHAGYGAMIGLGTGTLLEVFGLVQEDPSSLDAKMRQLESSHDAMLEQLASLGDAAATMRANGSSTVVVEAQMSNAVQAFMTAAMQIAVSG